MPKTTVRENETLDDALRRFKRQVNKAGTIQEARKREFFLNAIDEKARTIEDNVGSSITKMDAEIQKSLSHQKAENSRLDQQINQLKIDQNIIKNQLLIVQKRIEDIQLQIGHKF